MFTSCGYYFLQMGSLMRCKDDISLNYSEKLIKLFLTKNAFVKTADDEIMYMGKMFDIAKEENKGSIFIFYVYPDRQEDKILYNLKSCIQTEDIQKNTSHNNRSFNTSIDKDFSSISGLNIFFNIKSAFIHPFFNEKQWFNAMLSFPAPPPRLS
jgi:hypothetical protein